MGSDSHAVIDLLDEARRIELDERLASGQRGRFGAAALATAATAGGHTCLGWPQVRDRAGRAGRPGDGPPGHPRLAGAVPATALESVIFAGTAADVTDAAAGGCDVVRDGRHLLVPDVPAALAKPGRLLA